MVLKNQNRIKFYFSDMRFRQDIPGVAEGHTVCIRVHLRFFFGLRSAAARGSRWIKSTHFPEEPKKWLHEPSDQLSALSLS